MKEKEQLMQKNIVVWLGALLCCALWGSAFPGIKIGYQMFAIGAEDVATQILFAGCRFTLAGIFTILFGSIVNRKILIPQRSNSASGIRQHWNDERSGTGTCVYWYLYRKLSAGKAG